MLIYLEHSDGVSHKVENVEIMENVRSEGIRQLALTKTAKHGHPENKGRNGSEYQNKVHIVENEAC